MKSIITLVIMCVLLAGCTTTFMDTIYDYIDNSNEPTQPTEPVQPVEPVEPEKPVEPEPPAAVIPIF